MSVTTTDDRRPPGHDRTRAAPATRSTRSSTASCRPWCTAERGTRWRPPRDDDTARWAVPGRPAAWWQPSAAARRRALLAWTDDVRHTGPHRRRRPGRHRGGDQAGAAPAVDVTIVDKARFPRDKCCGDGLTTGALRLLEAPRLRARRACPPGATSTPRGSARRTGARSSLPAAPRARARSPPSPRGVELDAALVDLARSAGVKVHDGHGVPLDHGPRARPHPASRSTGSGTVALAVRHRRRRHVVARPQVARRSPSPATSASGTPSASTSATSPGRPPSASTCGSTPTCCPATPGRSRCPTGGPTSASAIARGTARCGCST